MTRAATARGAVLRCNNAKNEEDTKRLKISSSLKAFNLNQYIRFQYSKVVVEAAAC